MYTLKRYNFFSLYSVCVASLVDRSLRSFHLGPGTFTRHIVTLFILLQTPHIINHIHDYNILLSSLGSSSKSLNLEVFLGPLRSAINHWLPGVEGFLGVHGITHQECSGTLSWVHHHTYRTNQRHRAKSILGKIKACTLAIS